MVILSCNVFGSWSHGRSFSDRDAARVIFKYLASYFRFNFGYGNNLLKFFEITSCIDSDSAMYSDSVVLRAIWV